MQLIIKKMNNKHRAKWCPHSKSCVCFSLSVNFHSGRFKKHLRYVIVHFSNSKFVNFEFQKKNRLHSPTKFGSILDGDAKKIDELCSVFLLFKSEDVRCFGILNNRSKINSQLKKIHQLNAIAIIDELELTCSTTLCIWCILTRCPHTGIIYLGI